MNLKRLFSILLFSLVLFTPALFAQFGDSNDNPFCQNVGDEYGDLILDKISELTRIKCEYFELKNVLHMIIIPVVIIGSMVYAGTTFVSSRLGILKDAPYVHVILAASSALMALSFGAIGYITTLMLFLGVGGGLVLGGIMLFGVWSVIYVMRKKRLILFSYPRKVEKEIRRHRDFEKKVVNDIGEMINVINNWKNENIATGPRPKTDKEAADAQISMLQIAKEKVPELGNKIRNNIIKSQDANSEIAERNVQFNKIVECTQFILERVGSDKFRIQMVMNTEEIKNIEHKIIRMNEKIQHANVKTEEERRMETTTFTGRRKPI